jgi:DNA-directed RNA polymerase subunit RPC12/RpoP
MPVAIENNDSSLPRWEDAEYFCIQNYAEATSRCGWRGFSKDARLSEKESALVCPRCGSATLLKIRKGEIR